MAGNQRAGIFLHAVAFSDGSLCTCSRECSSFMVLRYSRLAVAKAHPGKAIDSIIIATYLRHIPSLVNQFTFLGSVLFARPALYKAQSKSIVELFCDCGNSRLAMRMGQANAHRPPSRDSA